MREKHNKKPPKEETERDVIYNTNGKKEVPEPGTRWRFEPFKAGTDR